MPDFRLQRFRGGWAIAEYRDGERVSRRRLDSRDAAGAAAEFARIAALASRPADPTVQQLWTLYRDDRGGRVIAANMEWSGRAILPFFGAMQPGAIQVSTCRAYVSHRRKAGRADGTIRTELSHLRNVLNWAYRTGMIAKAPAIELPPNPPPKDVRLTREQVRLLMDNATMPHIRTFIALAIATGGRAAALFDLTWDRVDFERGTIALGKAGTVRRKGRATVPMNRSLRDVLHEAKTLARTDHVIEWAGKPVSSVRTGLALTAERAGIDHVTPHVFRHSAAVWMAEDGVPMAEIAQYLGHSDDRITQRVYARFSPHHLRKASRSLDWSGGE